MKKIMLAAVAALGLASAASAATYTVNVTANPFRAPGQPGLQTRAVILAASGAQNFGGPTGIIPKSFSFNLTKVGDIQNVDLFGLVHYDFPVNADDLLPRSSTVTLNMGALGTATVAGQTFAVGTVGSTKAYAFADYTNIPLVFSLGGGLAIKATIADTVFGANSKGVFTNGRPGFGKVTATFTLATVPVPAGGLLLMGALGGLAATRRRKAAALI